MKYYEILPTHTETPRNTTRKITNLYIEFSYHFLTLQKKSHYFWTGVYKTNRPDKNPNLRPNTKYSHHWYHTSKLNTLNIKHKACVMSKQLLNKVQNDVF